MTTPEPVLYRWPEAARVGRVVPKNKFYEHGRISRSTRQRFIDEVQRITWAYKLATDTIHLRGNDDVPEIQVFTVDAKCDDVSGPVLEAIDRSVPFPIVFEVTRETPGGGATRMVAAHKLVRSGKVTVAGSHASGWVPAGADRSPMPPAIDLANLHAAIVGPLLPVAVVAGEPLAAAAQRADAVARIDRDVSALQRKLRTEPQFNRKVELRRQIKDQERRRAELVDPAPTRSLVPPT